MSTNLVSAENCRCDICGGGAACDEVFCDGAVAGCAEVLLHSFVQVSGCTANVDRVAFTAAELVYHVVGKAQTGVVYGAAAFVAGALGSRCFGERSSECRVAFVVDPNVNPQIA